jgi:uncharacterized membrane protein (DUF485 family)
MSDWPWVIASYALTWVVLGVYALRIRGQLAEATAELQAESQHSSSPMEGES